MNRRFFTSLKLSLAATVMLAMGAAQAHAVDTKIYGGAECVRGWQSGGSILYDSGSIYSDSTTYPLDVQCPVIHDSKNTSISSGKVRIVDLNNSTGANFLCSLNSAIYTESTFFVVSTGLVSNTTSPTFASSIRQEINFGALQIAAASGHHYVTCRIPPRSAKPGNFASLIDSYEVTEIQ